MNIVETFRAAWIFEAGWHGMNLLPTVLARAAARALAVDAAGLSLLGPEYDLPIAASSPQAATAEQWQFTLGSGPSRAAYDSNQPVVADGDEVQRRWPVLYDQLHQRTPVRSIVALPLSLGDQRIGVLNLYTYQAHPAAGFDLAAAQTVASMIYTSLLGATGDDRLDAELQAARTSDLEIERAAADPVWTDPTEPAWLQTTSVRRRQNVWTAVGMLLTVDRTDTSTALTMLRARAYAGGQTLDDLADDLLTGRVPAHELAQS